MLRGLLGSPSREDLSQRQGEEGREERAYLTPLRKGKPPACLPAGGARASPWSECMRGSDRSFLPSIDRSIDKQAGTGGS
mmetsp:Transcript_23319/g.45884  ORF Transcript_23319/g.45884 Transcript_23319/m.45884 type:complete len:80 (-) Transcript_23319:569-808(-)